ncbi:site-specific integrase [Bacteriovorax sp. PP10]|uniref:Site-specific integrase n=1 Tax=Bacteriovorax antarcticus TaxID=3088717 RepID=A0ABU5VTQ9_9BACT|nr:site-specific integrase [Bacteriovorax sp. PP10]MEA9356433.1 site-specific integrase [Bacteriovorax sp. PP10]
MSTNTTFDPAIGVDQSAPLITSTPGPELFELQQEFYRNLRTQGKSQNTLKNYKTDLDCFNFYLNTEYASVAVKNFDQSLVTNYGKYLENKYSSDNSRRRRVQALRIFFDFLLNKSLVTSNPVRKLPTSPKFLDIPRPTPFIDVKTLWTYLVEESHSQDKIQELLSKRNKILFLLIFGAGLKVSDLSELKATDITIINGEARVLIHHPKRDAYTVTLPKIFEKVYNDYQVILDEMKTKSQIQFDNLLFYANPYRIISGGLSPRGIEIIFEDYRNKLMITLTPKSLRQACIFKWIQQEKGSSLIKEWLGLAPSYDLKLYIEHAPNFLYNEDILEDIYNNYRKH